MWHEFLVRHAKVEDAPLLTDIAMRSKAHWGYSAEFMAAVRSELTITPANIVTDSTFVLVQKKPLSVATDEEIACGFYKLRSISAEQVELTDLFLLPDYIGRGLGRILWEHAVATARAGGYGQMTWESDPNAEGFYTQMGGRRIALVESTAQVGRMLPRMSYWLRGTA